MEFFLLGSNRFAFRFAEFPFYFLQFIICRPLLPYGCLAIFLNCFKLLAQLLRVLFKNLLFLFGVCKLSLDTAKLFLKSLHLLVSFLVFVFRFFTRFEDLGCLILIET